LISISAGAQACEAVEQLPNGRLSIELLIGPLAPSISPASKSLEV